MGEERAKVPLALTFLQRSDDKDQFLARIQVEGHRANGEQVLCATRVIARETAIVAGGRQDLTFVWLASGVVRYLCVRDRVFIRCREHAASGAGRGAVG